MLLSLILKSKAACNVSAETSLRSASSKVWVVMSIFDGTQDRKIDLYGSRG